MQPIKSENQYNFQENNLYDNSYNCVICGLNHYFHEQYPHPHEYSIKNNKKRERDNFNFDFDEQQTKKHKKE
jgi:hypothetical protein